MNTYAILIIDDDESTHDVLGDYLELAGFSVLHARDGAVGLELMSASRPDLVLLDVNMPVLDGFRTMETISKTYDLRDIPVLFLTTLDRTNLKIKGLELGAEDYIIKPFQKAELLARIKAALRRGERYRKNEKVMEGNFADLSLAEVLQTLDIGKKTACIAVRETSARVCIENGMIVFSEFRQFRGSDAFTRIFFLERGAYSISFELPDYEQAGSPMPIQKTLFESVTYLDEVRADIGKMNAAPGALVEIREGAPADVAAFTNLSPLRLDELIAYMPGELKANVAEAAKAQKDGALAIIKENIEE